MDLEAVKKPKIITGGREIIVNIKQNTSKRKKENWDPDDFLYDNDEEKEQFFRKLEEYQKNVKVSQKDDEKKVSWRDDDEKNKCIRSGKHWQCVFCKYYKPICIGFRPKEK